MIKYIFSCLCHTSIKTNDKLVTAEEQIPLMLGRFLRKSSGFCLM